MSARKKPITPAVRLRRAMKLALGAVRQVTHLSRGKMPELEPVRDGLSRHYAELMKKLEEQEQREGAHAR